MLARPSGAPYAAHVRLFLGSFLLSLLVRLQLWRRQKNDDAFIELRPPAARIIFSSASLNYHLAPWPTFATLFGAPTLSRACKAARAHIYRGAALVSDGSAARICIIEQGALWALQIWALEILNWR